VGDQPVSVRPYNYLEIAAIALHLQGDLLSSENRTFDKPNSPSPAGHPRAPEHPGRGWLNHYCKIRASGASYAYQYRQTNNIGANNLVQPDRVIDRLLGNTAITAVVLVDDFIGSGGTAIKSLEPLAARVLELHGRPDVSWFVSAVSGLATGAQAIEASGPGRQLDIRVAVAHPLLASDLPFGSDSTLFDEEEQRAFRLMLRKYEKRVGSTMSLGYGELAVPVVLPDNCPNNAPAALWHHGANWRPLFTRTAK
jgi:hypothetical protein